MDEKVLITLRRATLGYGHHAVLRDVNLELRRGDFLGIVGPNGCGKTTILKCLLGLMRPLAGAREGPGARQLRFGYVPQRETLDTIFPLTVMDLVLTGRYGLLGPGRRPGRADREAAARALEQAGILTLAHRGISELSGGQRQRALIARALACEPEVLVLDEPTNGLDLGAEHALLELFRGLHARGLTVVIVSHLLASVAAVARRIVLIAEGEIRIGARDDVLTPETLAQVYRLPVAVQSVNGRLAIFPETHAEVRR